VAHLEERGVDALSCAGSTEGLQFRVFANRDSVSRSRCLTRRCASSAVSCTISAVAAGDHENMDAGREGEEGMLEAMRDEVQGGGRGRGGQCFLDGWMGRYGSRIERAAAVSAASKARNQQQQHHHHHQQQQLSGGGCGGGGGKFNGWLPHP
jgi:hypothetical protein